MIPENIELIETRWPAVAAWLTSAEMPEDVGVYDDTPVATLRVEGIQLASAYDPRAEAELQARLIPLGSPRATVYGLGQGELVRVLLERAEIEVVRVVLMNPAVDRAVLATFDLTSVLSDRRVEVVRADDEFDLVPPFTLSPACLQLASDGAARLRDLIRLELATPRIRRHVQAQQAELQARLAVNRALVERDGDVAELFGTAQGQEVLVAAAGPSLAEHWERLASRGDRKLVAVDAALRPLLAAGVRPDVVVTCDTSEAGLKRLFDVEPMEVRATRLVYLPVVPNAILCAWTGPRLAAYADRALFAPLREALPRANLFLSGSVLHPAVDLACRMGAARVTLFGADFCVPESRTHVAGAALDRSLPDRRGRGIWVLNGTGQRVPSLANLVGYLRDLERYIQTRPEVVFVNASKSGAHITGAHYEEVSDAA